ncbi:MAG: sodium:alanine symporter family protein [Clostridia bacterium]|nr:sodium:alanine symporter family protein [Clostridia bacterium]
MGSAFAEEAAAAAPSFVDKVSEVNGAINSFAWGPIMLALLVGSGVYLSIRTGFIQVRKFGYVMKNTLGSLFKKSDKDHGKNLSPFQAVATALAGTVGTGNIAGVTGAIFVGGPGAVFWMWVSAFFGMCTKYAEIVLAMKYREKDKDGVYHGGPMYYIVNGLGKNWKWLAVVFAILGGLASFGIGNIAQSSEIAGAVNSLTGLSPLWVGILLAILVAIVVLGGVKRIGQVTSLMVPFMSIFYVVAGIIVIIMRIGDIPGVFAEIFKGAFSFKSVGGGIFGYAIMVAMRQGFARGVFSNEAGLGSAPMAHAASSTEEPVEQAIWGVFEVFFDTIVICSITALTVLLSGVWTNPDGLSAFASKGAAAVAAFNTILPGTIGGTIIQISLLFFALSTIISWSYYGETCWAYLTKGNKVVDVIYKVVFILMCIVGATGSGTLMWDIADTLNGLMALPNLIALIPLAGVVAKLTKDYFAKKNHELGK